METNFTDKHVLVTGGARGIGLEIVRQFCEAGATVSVFDYNEAALEQATERWRANGDHTHPFRVDVSAREQVIASVDEVQRIAPVDVLVNNAGWPPAPYFEGPNAARAPVGGHVGRVAVDRFRCGVRNLGCQTPAGTGPGFTRRFPRRPTT